MTEMLPPKVRIFACRDFPRVCGVYRLVNEQTGDCYVGSTQDCRQRIYIHRSKLRRGHHHLQPMQDHYQKHGAEAFTFEVLALVPKDQLLSVEREWIDRLRPSLNTLMHPDRPNPFGGQPKVPTVTRGERRERRRAIADAYRSGVKYRDIAASFGVGIHTVFHACREHGVAVRPTGPRGPRGPRKVDAA